MKIILDDSLEKMQLRKVEIDKFIVSMTDRKYNYKDSTYSQTLFPVEHSIENNTSAIHRNYLEYLEICWAKHYGAVISPDIIWYMLLCEIAQLIAEQPDRYRDLFTTSPDQQEICVCTDDPEVLPIGNIMDELRSKIPNEFSSVFLDDFSTTTIRSACAKYAAFADIVSPYYSYNMFMCGIPFIELLGTQQDWVNLSNRWTELVLKLKPEYTFSDDVSQILYYITNSFYKNQDDFWKYFFFAAKCGSGSETELYGHITKLFRKQPDEVRKSCNFSSHISNVKYKNISTGLNYQMKQGLFYSTANDNLLVPDFAMVICEDKSQ